MFDCDHVLTISNQNTNQENSTVSLSKNCNQQHMLNSLNT